VTVQFSIRDTGKGFDSTKPKSGLGLVNMTHRAKLLNGTLKVELRPGQGTTFTCVGTIRWCQVAAKGINGVTDVSGS